MVQRHSPYDRSTSNQIMDRTRVAIARLKSKYGAYEYTKLSTDRREIRLLDLHAGRKTQSLEGDLVVVCLDDHPEYETISYVWGGSSTSSTLKIGQRYIAIPKGTEAALRRVRMSSGVRRLWIDAVCINQRDVVERGQQVAMMGDIYSGCRQTLVHLGEVEDRIMLAKVHQAIVSLLEDARKNTDDLARFRLMFIDPVSSHWRYDQTGLGFEVELDVMEYLLRFPWFCRLWVVQEVICAPQNIAMLGEHQYRLLDILRAIRWWKYRWPPTILSDSAIKGDQCISWMWNMLDQPPKSTPLPLLVGLSDALLLAREFDKTEPRDGIFAIRALLAEIPAGLAVPDYAAALPNLLMTVTKAALDIDTHLHLLSRHQLRPGDLESSNIASWAWRADLIRDHDLDGHALPSLFDAARGLESTGVLPPCEDSALLRVEGFQVEGVSTVSPALTQWKSATFAKWFFEAWAMFRGTRMNETQSALLGEFAMTLCARQSTRGLPVDEHTMLDIVRLLTSLALGNTFESNGRDAVYELAGLANFSLCLHRCFFITESGRPGIGPEVMLPGDLITVIKGSKLLFVLRPLGGNYQFVGAAHVHGIMEGEAVKTYTDAGGTSEVFTLR